MAFIGTFSPDVPLTNRNIIINGAMQVAQRNTSVTGITTSGYYTADRWQIAPSSAGTWTMNVDSSGPTGTEFRKSANLVCTTADSSLSAGDYLLFAQNIEGQNVQGIKKGTANAESITLSFWVKSSNTGTFVCEFRDVDNGRHFAKTYTVNTANTWEKKTITAPPDTTGQFDNDNANSFIVNFWLAAGTTFTSGTLPDTAWASLVSANRVVGQLNLANLAGNYWAVTGIQLEIGETATNYEMRSFAEELRMCQRYCFARFASESDGNNYTTYCLGNVETTTNVQAVMQLPVKMRTFPSLTTTGTASNYSVYSAATATALSSVPSISTATSPDLVHMNCTVASGLTAGRIANLMSNNNRTSYLIFSAEL